MTSEAGALPPGRWTPRNLLAGPDGAPLEVGRDGQVRGYVPVTGALGRRQVLVLDLVRR
jgi:hypothetical protein